MSTKQIENISAPYVLYVRTYVARPLKPKMWWSHRTQGKLRDDDDDMGHEYTFFHVYFECVVVNMRKQSATIAL